jgi:protein SCO1/2
MSEERKIGRLGFVWGGLGLVVATLLLAFLLMEVNARNSTSKPLPVYGEIANFSLTNQNGTAVSLGDLRGHVWVADIIFTRCPGPCAKMTSRMKELQQALAADNNTRLVSLTTDPEFDSPAVLKTYGERFGADPARWTFLTGTKTQIAKLAIDSLKLTAIEKNPEDREASNDLFIHSTIFVLVDKQARLRAVFESSGDDVDPRKVQADILDAARRLDKER